MAPGLADVMAMDEQVAANLAAVRERIAQAAGRAGRRPEEITLVAVSKTKPVPLIAAALEAGQLDFGENRPEEAWRKFANPEEPKALCHRLSAKGPGYRLHLIGPIQSRKVGIALACEPVLIHSLDRLKVARRLDRLVGLRQRVQDVLLEVNIAEEASKHGFTLEGLELAAGQVLQLPNLRIRGLMTMPPYDPNPEAARPHFHRLRMLRDQLVLRWPQADWSQLSMGMSHDLEVAIEEGATLVRVGTAIFGAR